MNKRKIFGIMSALIIVSIGQSLAGGANVFAGENKTTETPIATSVVATDTIKNTIDEYGDFVFDKEKGQIIQYNGDSEILKIPDEIDGVKVRSIYGQNLAMPDGKTKTIFKNAEKIKKVVIPSSVESIEAFAFNGCPNLKEVELSEGLKTIGDFAFCDTSIEKIHIPDSVVSIGECAFSGINPLKEINIPKGMKSIDKDILSNSVNVEKIDMAADVNLENYTGSQPIFSGTVFQKNHTDSNGLYIINDFLCGYYGKGEEITIPDNVKKMTNNLFSCNRELKKVTIGKGLLKVSNSAFCSCTNLKEVDLSNSNIEEIGDKAFFGAGIEKISLGASTKSLGHLSFYSCTNLSQVDIANKEVLIADDAFNEKNCVINIAGEKKSIKDINYVNFEFDKETGIISAYTGSAINLIIPSEINGAQVKKIEANNTLKQKGYGILGENKTVENIIFAEDCKDIIIAKEAFENSEHINDINITGVSKIEPFAFYGNSNSIQFSNDDEICISKYAFTNTLFGQKLTENKTSVKPEFVSQANKRYEEEYGEDKDIDTSKITTTTVWSDSGDNGLASIAVFGLLGSALIIFRGIKKFRL